MTTKETGVFASMESFFNSWDNECDKTEQLFKTIPEPLWYEELIPGYRSLARLAWHIVQTPGEILERIGVTIAGPLETDPVPSDSERIILDLRSVWKSVKLELSSQWTDETLLQTDDMYGEVWTRSMTLTALIHHMIHHRAQMTVLLRIGKATVPGLYGPAKEDWAQFGMPVPAI